MTTKESSSCPLTSEQCIELIATSKVIASQNTELIKSNKTICERLRKLERYMFASKVLFWGAAGIVGLFAWFFDHASAIKDAINGWLDTDMEKKL